MLTTGQSLQNRYRIDAVLGQGGMGAVYRAYDSRLDRVCVIKEMSLDSEVAEQVSETVMRSLAAQFWQEAKILSKLNHPNLPRVGDYFEESGGYYLAMDLVEGQSLQKLIPMGGMPEAVVLAYADQLLEVLEYIHSQGVLHRDIKPANIIVQPAGRVVLVDFGLVKVLKEGQSLTTRSYISGAGTQGYQPPEQTTGHTDQRSDIYAVGATLYHALTGQPPVPANIRVVDEALITPRQLNPQLSVKTEQVVMQAMALRRGDRFADAHAMRMALGGQNLQPKPAQPLAERMVMAPPASAPDSGLKTLRVPTQPRRALTWGIGLVALAGILVVAAIVLTILVSQLGASPSPTLTPLASITRTAGRTPAASKTPAATLPQPSPTNAEAQNDTVLTLEPGVTLELVRVPAGEFTMGSAANDTQAYDTEKPQHQLTLDEYWIGKYEVTTAQFAAFVKATGYKTTAEQQGFVYTLVITGWQQDIGVNWQHPQGPGSSINGRENYPVGSLSWDDAVAFCKWASQVTGRKIQLPTEAQWEKAARGPSTGPGDVRIYPWGNDAPDNTRLNFDKNLTDTTPVGQYSPKGDSPYGTADMAGNVWEWTSSLFKPYPYKADDGREDQSSRETRVSRSGSYVNNATNVRAAVRLGLYPYMQSEDSGFRVVVSLPGP